ncbi:nitrilase-related carbon-nitrogen hydrolase [Geofilum rhodophaeum]|uniref:nitrilase-related carbon-nitrogen hydrolase n=1 Tax=Geofilum rhodophaeum TaxID=1965019 RepID=UPI000B52553D|nr:nitrilase-related carbon-nitrogen hydrolase [Geofilum rhodophaeum]
MRLGMIQLEPRLGQVAANTAHVLALLQKAPPADLWILPELASSGYAFGSREAALASSETLEGSVFLQALQEWARSSGSWVVTGFNERSGDVLYNSAVLLSPSGVEGLYRKLHLFLNEQDFFTPGNLGLPVFDTPWGRLGMLVCFDWMFPEVWRLLALKGVQLIAHPSNLVLPWCQTAMPGYALTNRVFTATCNRVGSEGELHFTGQSLLVSPTGEALLRGSADQEEVLVSEVDWQAATNKAITSRNDAFGDRRTAVYGIEIKASGEQ